MSQLRITDVQTILTAPEGVNLVVVKVYTSDAGLYGVGCATFTQRFLAVKTVIDEYLKDLLIGRDPTHIEDIWNTLNVQSYWRNGPVLNNAMSGVDMALWDIKGKLANMPLCDLLGGRSRMGVAVYRHAEGTSKEEVLDNLAKFVEQGYKYVRCQMGGYGLEGQEIWSPKDSFQHGIYYDPAKYMRSTIDLFQSVREKFGYELQLIHDVHERLAPSDAINFAKEMEQFKLFYLEDLFSPEQSRWFENLRQHSSIPIAMGELFNNPNEWIDLITNRYIDFIRVHLSQIGGITPSKKLATLSSVFGVRTAWHGPPDLTPIGHAANIHLSMHFNNFGIQEFSGWQDPIYEVFTDCPYIENGYIYLSDKPGLGVDIDEEKAKKYPYVYRQRPWTQSRMPDGTMWTP